jgi:hypothetical protein
MFQNGPYFQNSISYSIVDGFQFFFLFNMHVKELCNWAFIHIIFIISLTTLIPHSHNDIIVDRNFNTLNGLVMDYLSVIIGPPYLATTQNPSFS